MTLKLYWFYYNFCGGVKEVQRTGIFVTLTKTIFEVQRTGILNLQSDSLIFRCAAPQKCCLVLLQIFRYAAPWIYFHKNCQRTKNIWRIHIKNRKPWKIFIFQGFYFWFYVAESERFELSVQFCRTHTFQACSLNHSDNSPFFFRACKNIDLIPEMKVWYFFSLFALSLKLFRGFYL